MLFKLQKGSINNNMKGFVPAVIQVDLLKAAMFLVLIFSG
jgi:hypothetical protein